MGMVTMDIVKQTEAFWKSGFAPDNAIISKDTATTSGMAFLVGEFEKQDPRVLQPLTNTTYIRDMPIKTGGGWVETVSNVYAEYATTGSNENAFINGESTVIPISQASMTKDLFKAKTFAEIVRVPYLEEAKFNQIGRSLNNLYDTGLRLNYDKWMDYNTYKGFSTAGYYGLINNPIVTSSLAPNGAAGTATWATKTPDEILRDINYLITQTQINSEFSEQGICNHILIDPTNFNYIAMRPIGIAGYKSILEWVLDNNIAKIKKIELNIFDSRWCIGTGAGGTNRMIAYRNDESKINMHTTVPLSRLFTTPNATAVAIDTLYASQVSQVCVLYPQTVRYLDGI